MNLEEIEELSAPLVAVAPEVGVPLELGLETTRRAGDAARSFGHWFIEEAGWTKEANYEGLIPALGLGYYYLEPPLKTLWGIEQQFAAVLDQAFRFLGGTGSALEHFASNLANPMGLLQAAGADLKKLSGGWL